VDGLVLDLRDNRGGLVSEGLEVARLFLGGGAPIVLTQSRAMSADVPRAAAGPPLSSAPLAVLVDDHTASASEILAGALKDNCRAVLVGRQTYGKGLIQSVYELSDGSGLVITVGRYLTPARVDIDREGIRPNFRDMPSAERAEQELEACRIGGGVGGR
jgi:C-terminal peptidase prc